MIGVGGCIAIYVRTRGKLACAVHTAVLICILVCNACHAIAVGLTEPARVQCCEQVAPAAWVGIDVAARGEGLLLLLLPGYRRGTILWHLTSSRAP